MSKERKSEDRRMAEFIRKIGYEEFEKCRTPFGSRQYHYFLYAATGREYSCMRRTLAECRRSVINEYCHNNARAIADILYGYQDQWIK